MWRSLVQVGVVLAMLGAPAWAAKRVAVLELRHPQAVPADAAGYLTDRIRQVAQGRAGERLLLLTRQNLAAMLPPGTAIEDCEGECEVETGRNLGVDYVISGRIVSFGAGLRAILTLHDTASGRQLESANAGGGDLLSVEAGLVAATQRLVDATPEMGGGAPAALAVAPGAGRLVVTAPIQSRILVDGEQVGVAPATLSLAAGARHVVIEHPCGGRWSGTLPLFPGRDLPLTVDFETECARVDLHSTPMGAQVILDGAPLGETPLRVYLKRSERTPIELRKPGLLPLKTSLWFSQSASRPMTFTLLPPAKAVQIVGRRPDGSDCPGQLRIDGRAVGATPWQGTLGQGRYTLETRCGPRVGRETISWPQATETIHLRTRDNQGELRFDLYGLSTWQLALGGWFMERKTGALRVGLEFHGGRYRLNHADSGYEKAVNHFGGGLRFAIPMSDWLDWELGGAVDVGWSGCAEDARASSDCKGKERIEAFDIFPTLSARTGVRYDMGWWTASAGLLVHRPFMYRIPEYSVIPYLGTSLLF